jgi:CelD/BcsL family acetyltransferase involved in cellulose biosynthesis
MRDTIDMLDLTDHHWAAFVDTRPEATVFHHPTWVRLLAECYGYHPFILSMRDGAGGITAGVPAIEVRGIRSGRRWITLPFTDYCPPLGVSERAIEQLVTGIGAQVRAGAAASFELRASPPGAVVTARPEAVRHTLMLGSDPAIVRHGFSKMHQRNIRKAEKSALRVEQGASATDLDTFYRLHLLTRRRLGVPVQPRRFFHLLGEHVLARARGFVMTVRLDEIPIASAVFLCWNGTIIYKYGASDERYWEHRPNNLLFWRAIAWGCEHNCHTFDWGRTDLQDEGLREFKRGWGAVEEPLAYTTLAASRPKAATGRLGRMLGNVIRRSPPAVCRVVGELFYKYAA